MNYVQASTQFATMETGVCTIVVAANPVMVVRIEVVIVLVFVVVIMAGEVRQVVSTTLEI